jgi:bifunctional DNase/RNase
MNRVGRLVIVSGLAGLMLAVPAASSTAGEPKDAAPPGQVRIQKVEVRASAVGPVVLLRVQNRAIPILVDAVVAESILGALSGKKLPRPLTHDLMHNILEGFEGKVSQVLVTLKDRTYYGALAVVMGKTTRVFDSRSSDAIALAIHFKAPILVSQELLDTVGVELEKPGGTLL